MLNPAFTEPLTVTRATPGTWTDGTFIAGPPTTVTLQGSVQPLKGVEQLNLPEGQRTRENVKIFSLSALQAANEAQGLKADIVTRANGTKYEVHQVATWTLRGTSRYRAIAARVEPPPG